MNLRGYAFQVNPNTLPAGGSTDRFAISGVLAQYYTDAGSVGTSETDLYSYTIKANTLSLDGSSIYGYYAGILSSSASNKTLRAYLNGTLLFDSGALNTPGLLNHFALYVNIIRSSSTAARASVTVHTDTNTNFSSVNYTTVTSLNFATNQTLKITGQASGGSAADNDIVAKLATVQFLPAI